MIKGSIMLLKVEVLYSAYGRCYPLDLHKNPIFN
jgi:hypothetical protein